MQTRLSIIARGDQPQSWQAGLEERRRLKSELLIKYQEELAQASWWKKILIHVRILREIDRVLLNRLYSKSERTWA